MLFRPLCAALIALPLVACQTGTGNAPPPVTQAALSGPSVAFTPPPVGSTFKMLDDTYKVTAATGDSVTMHHASSGKDVTVIGGVMPFWNLGRRSVDRDAVGAIWPLQVGKATRVKVAEKVGSIYWLNDMRVLRQETVTVPAGTFETYVVEVVERSSTNNYEGRNLYWYAPDLGVPVKRDFEYVKGTGASKDYELQDYTLAK